MKYLQQCTIYNVQHAVLALFFLACLYTYNLLLIALIFVVSIFMIRSFVVSRASPPTKMLEGKVAIIVSQVNTGMCLGTACGLVERGARVIIACSDIGEGEARCKNVEDKTGSSLLQFSQIDLQSLSSVRKFAREILEKEQILDILVFCGGQGSTDQTLSEDGQEVVFQVNHLSPFLLTNMLLGALKASESSRVVTVINSGNPKLMSEQNVNKVAWTTTPHDKKLALAQAALANILFVRELSERAAGTSVHTYCMDTSLISMTSTIINYCRSFFTNYEQMVAEAVIKYCVDEKLEDQSGRFYDREGKEVDFILNRTLAENLWNSNKDIVGDTYGLHETNNETSYMETILKRGNSINNKSRNATESSSDSEEGEDEQIVCFQGDDNMEISVKNLTKKEEENTSIQISHQSSTVTRRIIKTVISTTQASSRKRDIQITEL